MNEILGQLNFIKKGDSFILKIRQTRKNACSSLSSKIGQIIPKNTNMTIFVRGVWYW